MDKKQVIEKWFIDHNHSITKYLVYYTGHTDVEDMVQDCFLKAYQGLDQYNGNSEPKTWLISIARNLAIDKIRRDKILNFIPNSLLSDRLASNQSVEETVLWNEDLRKIYQIICSLKRNYRDVTVLRGIMDLSSKETSYILNWSENKVDVTFHRAVQKIRKLSDLREGDNYVQL